MMNSHPQLVLLSTFASNMTNRIMVDFIVNIISTYLLTFIVQCMKSRYPTVVSLLRLLMIIMPDIVKPSFGEKNHWITFYGPWSTFRPLQWKVVKRLLIFLNCPCISIDLLPHRDEWFSHNHERQEPILTNWTWKPPPRPGGNGQPTCAVCFIMFLLGKGRRFLFRFFLA